MEQNTAIKKKLNYPILLLLIVTILQVKDLFGAQRAMPVIVPLLPPFITKYFAIPAFIVLPLLLFVLWRDRFEKAKAPKVFAGLLLVAGAVCTLIYSSGGLAFLFRMLGQGGVDLFKIAIEFFDICAKLLQTVMFIVTALTVFTNAKDFTLHYVICGLSLVAVLFLGTISIMYRRSDVISFLGYVLMPLALWYVPKVLQDRTAAEITPKKMGTLILVAVIALCLFIAAGGPSKPSSSSAKVNTCGSCDRSWPAGDDGGNFMNIAKTGLCKNCENNYHNLKQYLDNED